MEDSRNALFVEPNAYIQKVGKEEKSPSKIIFQEPYESVPNFYMNNGFKKGECDCVHKEKNDSPKSSFDIKSLSPILSMLGGETSGLSKLVQGLGSGGGFKDIISTIISNPEMISMVVKMFRKDENKSTNKTINKSDLEIKNYTKVE